MASIKRGVIQIDLLAVSMPIYRCNQCSFVSEDARYTHRHSRSLWTLWQPQYGLRHQGSTLKSLLSDIALREVNALQQADKPNTDEAETQTTAEESTPPTSALASIDPSNTAMLATAEQHAPLLTWFAARQIEVRFDYTLVDTSGFFDDAARMLGDRYELYAELIDRVRFAYRKSHTWISLELSKLSQKTHKQSTHYAVRLYSHTFFARYHYQKA